MRITSIRIKGTKPTSGQLFDIMEALRRAFKRAGFVTGLEVKSSTALKIGLHMCSFRIDRAMHDRNLRHNPYTGTKLTDIPTWDQRVEFNNIVNCVLTRFKVSARVTSGPFLIRDGFTHMTERDWHDQKPEWIRHNEARGWYVEACDEQAFIAERRERRNREAREARRLTREAAAQQAQQPVLQLVQGGES